jgi:hypothetical protein
VARGLPDTGPAGVGAGERDLETLITHVGESVATLKEGLPALDECFRAVGNGLERLPGASDAVLEEARTLLGLRADPADSGGGNAVAEHLRELLAPLAYLDRFRDGTASVLTDLEACGVRINRLLAAEQELTRTVAPLQYLRSLLRVEVARLDPEVQSTFLSLAEEMHLMCSRLGDAFAGRFDALRANRTRAGLLIADMRSYLDKELQSLALRKARVESCVAGFHRQLEARAAQNARLESASREVVVLVGRMVVFMQAHDIFAQRLSHVFEALCFDPGTAAPEGSRSPERDPRQLFCTAALEQRQLVSIEEDLVGVERGLNDALSGIGARIEGILAEVQGGAETSSEAPLAVLLRASKEVGGMLEAAIGRLGRTHAELIPLREQASSVTATIRKICLEMRLIAINSQVQAALLGSGSAVEVLAGEAASIANTADALGRRVVREMDELGEDLGRLLDFCDRLRSEGREHLDLMARDGLAREAAMEERWSVQCGRVLGAAESLRGLVASMRNQSGVGSRVRGELCALRESLAALERAAGDRLEAAGDTREGVLQALIAARASHTMQSERAVVTAVAEGGVIAAGDPTALTGVNAGEVELF